VDQQRARPRPDRPGRVADDRPLPTMYFLGHSTVLIETDGVRVLTDPVLLSFTSVLRRTGAPLDPALHADIDVVCISHLHADHLDFPSLRALGGEFALIVPAGAGPLLRRKGFARVTELAPDDATVVRSRSGGGAVRITATHADHDGYRQPFGPRAAAVGYLVESEPAQGEPRAPVPGPAAAGARVYFAGDTDLFDGMADLGARDLDVALIPVWGWGPNLGPGHLDPRSAAEATRRLRPRYAVPIHWGTLHPYGIGRWMRGHLIHPPRRYAQAVGALDLPTRVLHTEPGARVVDE
jgi:L-ascorbate metabolism protein UlaG (beta-lactamase superfamily)